MMHVAKIAGAGLMLVSALAVAATAAAADQPYRPVTDEIQVNLFTPGKQIPFSIAGNARGEFVVGWSSNDQDGDQEGIYARRYDAVGRALTGEVAVNQRTAGVQFHSTVAMDAQGNFVVAWNQVSPLNGDIDMFYRLFNAAGRPLTGELSLNVTTAGTQIVFGASMSPDGRFVLAWTSDGQDGDNLGVYVRLFSADGQPRSGEIQASVVAASRQTPAPGGVAMQPDGSFVITWESFAQDGDNFGVYARRFDADGAPLTGDIAVNSTTAGAQRPGGVASNPAGDFVVAWRSDGQDGDGTGAYARVFAADGAPLTAEIPVNQFITGEQRPGGVAMDAQGDFVVVWRSAEQDGSNLGAYARRFSRDGVALTDEFRLNQVTARAQLPVGVTADPDGDFVATWSSGVQDGSEAGVYVRRFAGGSDIDLGLDLRGPAGRIRAGEAFRYAVDVRNLQPLSALTGVTAIDGPIGNADRVRVSSTPPPGAVFTRSVGSGWTCTQTSAPDGRIDCEQLRSLGATQSAPALALDFVAGSTTGLLAYDARVEAAQFDSRDANDAEARTLTVCDGGRLDFARSGIRRSEGAGAITLTVTRSGTVCGPASVTVRSRDLQAVAGSDYAPVDALLTWGDRQTGVRRLTLTLIDDAQDEPLEALTLDLVEASNAVAGERSELRVEIADDD